MSKRSWTDDDFIIAVKQSYSIGGVLRHLGLRPGGGTYDSIYFNINRLDLSTDHFTGQAWRKGKPFITKRRDVSKYLVCGGPRIGSHALKLRLIRDGIFSYKCAVCGGETWRGLPIPLELDHINGDRYDNRLENLRLLCANCHAQTDTYCGKNKKRS